MAIKFEQVFNIGDRVYYKLPESPMGIVIDITYRHSAGIIMYEVQWNPEDSYSICRDYELCVDKIMV
jgi:hypothetical protein